MYETGLGSDLVTKVLGWYEKFVLQFPNIIAAFIVLVLFYVLSRWARKAALAVSRRVSGHRAIANLFVTIASIAMLGLGVIVALEILNLGGAVSSLLTGAGILGFALGFAFQDIISNFISGVIIAAREPFKVGDLIKTNDYFGVAETPTLRATNIQTPDGQIVTLPNKDIILNPLVNYTKMKKRRVDIKVGVAYDSDLKKVEKAINNSIKQVKHRVKEEEIEVFFEEFGDSSINVLVRFWIQFVNSQKDYYTAQSTAIQCIKESFEKEKITIPYPTSTIISKS